jgi:CRP-like cAMP-binding protein
MAAADDARQEVRNVLEAFAAAPLPDWPAFAATMTTRRARQGQVFQSEDDPVAPSLYLVTGGVVHVRLVSPDAPARTVNFARPGDLMASLPVIERRSTAPISETGRDSVLAKALAAAAAQRYRHTALTAASYVEIPLHEMHLRAHRSVAWGRALATAYLVYAQVMRYERDRMRLPAEARYRSFLVDYAPTLRHIQQKDIADYLGVSVVGLSRIASRVRREAAGDEAVPSAPLAADSDDVD